MQIIAKCPKCDNNWLLEAIAADRRIRCPRCRKLFKVPNLDEIPKATKIINQSCGGVYVDKDGKTYG